MGGPEKGPNDPKHTSCWNIQVIHDCDSETYLGPCKQTCKFMEVPLVPAKSPVSFSNFAVGRSGQLFVAGNFFRDRRDRDFFRAR